MEPAISLQNVRKRFGEHEVLKGISFDVMPGTITAIIGSSGSGKTTLLRALNGLCTIDSGTINIQGFLIRGDAKVDLRRLREHVGMVFQQFNLWPHKTVLENLVEAPIIVRGMTREKAMESAIIRLKQVGLEEKCDAYPISLSGGQQQRVAIARTLMMEPQVLLFDEVTSALDPELAWGVLQVIRTLAKERSQTMVIVTHEMSFAREIADEVLFLDNGIVLERGHPSVLFASPTQERTKAFLGRFLA